MAHPAHAAVPPMHAAAITEQADLAPPLLVGLMLGV